MVTLTELEKGLHPEEQEEPDFYPPRVYLRYQWGMAIDMQKCTGCGACVTACYAENNIPFVGKELVAKRRGMEWLRIERYFKKSDNKSGFETIFLPMLCQQCNNAPCEPVCPVYATYHNPEGLNGMVYNRCVGTRYCSNNCVYKVRRFNWFSYKFPEPLNWQLNPDVTVRDKGVMEKCTFCIQRINFAKDQAKDKGRDVLDGEIQTACQQSCASSAIVFGNLKDPESEVSKLSEHERRYKVLRQLNAKPNITYLKKVKWDKA
jgi:Fe-S-cluster-containing dehydrogenase component